MGKLFLKLVLQDFVPIMSGSRSDQYIAFREKKMKSNTRNLVLTSLFLAIAIVVQLIGRFNPDISRVLVGPVINTILLLTAYFCGKRYGLIMPFLTPLMALITGQLNPLLTPFIPFIILGNLALVIPFMLLLSTPVRRTTGILLGSGLKYLVMSFAAANAVSIFGLRIPASAAKMLPVAFGTVQLFAALAGGAIAMVLIQLLKNSWERSAI